MAQLPLEVLGQRATLLRLQLEALPPDLELSLQRLLGRQELLHVRLALVQLFRQGGLDVLKLVHLRGHLLVLLTQRRQVL